MAPRTRPLLLAALLLIAGPALAKKPKPSCLPGRFLLPEGARVLTGGASPSIDAVIVDAGGTIRIASGCRAVRAKAAQTKSGPKLTAKFPAGACAGVKGKAKLVAKADSTCATLTATFSAKKLRTAFTARRSACGDGVADTDAGETCDLPVTPPLETAVSKLADTDTGGFPAAEKLSPDPNGEVVVRDEIEIAFQPTATPAQLDALVASVGGQVISSLAGVARVVVRIPDPGTLDGLDLVLAQLRADPLVREVRRGVMPGTSVLPTFPDLSPAFNLDTDINRMDHQLAVGAPAAWNARTALPSISVRPFVVVADYFGNGPPDHAFDVSGGDNEFGTSGLVGGGHGYHVLGIIAGRFDGFPQPSQFRNRNLVTGIYPGTVPLRVVEVQATVRTENQMLLRVIAQQATSPLPVIVNTSVGFSCDNQARAEANCLNPDHYLAEARAWIEKVRGAGGGNLESRFLHVTAAGNADWPPDTDARHDSEYLAASLSSASELGVAPLSNVVAVENRTRVTTQHLARVGCLSSTSKRGGNISAIGDHVYSLIDARESATALTADFKDGTSMASPQVAGLAAYVLSLRRTLSVAQLKSLLLATARDVPGCGGGAKVIDAYAAVLATDRPGDLAVRRTILDVRSNSGADQGDGAFNQNDLDVLLDKLDSGGGATDYSRYDLNGDGRTGGPERARFDLDVNDPPAYTRLTRPLGSQGPVDFDEAGVTDLEVLCFYAYSPLFTGSPDERDGLLGNRCAPCPTGQGNQRANDQCEPPPTTTTPPPPPASTTTLTPPPPTTSTRPICQCPEGFECCAGTFCCF